MQTLNQQQQKQNCWSGGRLGLPIFFFFYTHLGCPVHGIALPLGPPPTPPAPPLIVPPAPNPHPVCDYKPCQCWHHIPTIARLLRLKQNVYFALDPYAWTTFSHSHLHVATNPAPEIPKVREQLPEWWVVLHLYVNQYTRVWAPPQKKKKGRTRYLFIQHLVNLRGYDWGMLADKLNKQCFKASAAFERTSFHAQRIKARTMSYNVTQTYNDVLFLDLN